MSISSFDLDPIRKKNITETLKILKSAVKEMEQLQKHNFSGLYYEEGNGPSPKQGNIPAKYRLLDLGNEIVEAGAYVLRCAADLND